MSIREIQFIDMQPDSKVTSDPVIFGYKGARRVEYYKVCRIGLEIYTVALTFLQSLYAIIYCNMISVWTCKFAILTFYYEIFPRQRTYRWVLHLCTAILACTLIASVLQAIFWCNPIHSFWKADPDGQCQLKLDTDFIRTQAGLHIGTIILVVILPLVILAQIRHNKPELMFALTVLGLGVVSVAGSTTAFLVLQKMALDAKKIKFTSESRHAATLMHLVDLNAIFFAGCLSAVKVRVQRKLPPMQSNALVIEVEKSWTVQVEMVSSWGGKDTDAMYGNSTKGMSVHQMHRPRRDIDPDIEAIHLTRGSGTSRVPIERSESATGFV